MKSRAFFGSRLEEYELNFLMPSMFTLKKKEKRKALLDTTSGVRWNSLPERRAVVQVERTRVKIIERKKGFTYFISICNLPNGCNNIIVSE